MKKLFVISFLFLNMAFSNTLEFMGGALTSHYPFQFNVDEAHLYKFKISDDGLMIFNPMFGVRLIHETNSLYFGGTVYGGLNSLGDVMLGVMGDVGFRVLSDWLHLGLVAGGYSYYYAGRGTLSFMPIGGIEVNVKVHLGKKVFVKINNIITPILINNSLSFGVNL